jgi:hypothetical protein
MHEQFEGEAREVQGAAFAQAVSFFVVGLLTLALDPFPIDSPIARLRLAHSAWCATWIAILVAQRRAPRLEVALAAYLVVVAPQLATFWAATQARLAAGVEWEPLLRQKFIFLIVALWGPVGRVALTLALLAAFLLEVCGEYWANNIRERLPDRLDEPWATFAFAALGVWLFLSRARHAARERVLLGELARLVEERRIVDLALQALDLSNTPLQTLTIQLTLLQERLTAKAGSLRAMSHALDQLVDLSGRLRKVGNPPPERPEDRPAR